ncbi:hypothetical protein AVEN_200676-1 [Araneus ventricosus]|uniref:Uncharacterized protein n=1 Tax=Araneus ventricosus TaxID=182803 RepID=A0A4Y2L415_ARAVE|nr:hypothetical protein AVEN_17519-1 [Araneus ventricosus]GBN08356.1 hypothetical protein AVEN_148170-1 [Araneus ventricosus]GBN08361.1 hypothetical protein AVEN_166081-1 [Araneus ventricosus]GBN08372.1 hypothetical protein AVEN_200676-1 [Araneus ventricosus]
MFFRIFGVDNLAEASSPYGALFKSTKPATLPSVIFNLMGNQFNGYEKAIAGKILQQLYPEAAGEQTYMSFTPSYSEESFSRIEIDNIHIRFPKSKAPGFDGID